MRSVYAIQPYEVGTKNHKGLVIYIPREVKKKCDIDTSSIFNLKIIKSNQLLLYGPHSNSDIGREFNELDDLLCRTNPNSSQEKEKNTRT